MRFELAKLKRRLTSVQLSRVSVAQRLQKVNFRTEEAAFAAVSTFKKTILDYLLNVSYSIAKFLVFHRH